MKKKSILRSLLFTLMFLLIVPQVSLGEEPELEVGEEGDVELGESVTVEGLLSQPNLSDEESAMAAHTVVTTISGPTLVKKFDEYLTGSWAKASSYRWSKTNSASSSNSSDVGVSASTISYKVGESSTVMTSYSVTVTVPANSSRYSKLAFYSSFAKRYVRVRLYNTQGLVYSDKNTYHYAPRKDTYLQVVYQ